MHRSTRLRVATPIPAAVADQLLTMFDLKMERPEAGSITGSPDGHTATDSELDAAHDGLQGEARRGRGRANGSDEREEGVDAAGSEVEETADHTPFVSRMNSNRWNSKHNPTLSHPPPN